LIQPGGPDLDPGQDPGAVPDPGQDAAVQDLRVQGQDQIQRTPESQKGHAQDPRNQIQRKQSGQDPNLIDLDQNLTDPGQNPTNPDQNQGLNPDPNLEEGPVQDLVNRLNRRMESRMRRNLAQDPDQDLGKVIGQIELQMITKDPGLEVEEMNENDAIFQFF